MWWSQSWMMVSRLTIESNKTPTGTALNSNTVCTIADMCHVHSVLIKISPSPISKRTWMLYAILSDWKQVFITTVSCLPKLLARLSVTLPTNVWNQNSTIILSTSVVLIVHVRVVELLECYLYVILVPWSDERKVLYAVVLVLLIRFLFSPE